VVVGDADAVVVGEVDAVVVEQHLEHVVALARRAGDRSEDPDARCDATQRIEHSERDRRLARVAFCGGDVDASRHMLNLLPGGRAEKRAPRFRGKRKASPRTRQSPVTLATFPSWGSWPGCRHAESCHKSISPHGPPRTG